MPTTSGLDATFPYPTAKIARIKDARLGLLRYALTCIIIVYVVGFQILWKGNHLETREIAGVNQLQLDHPTSNNCNPRHVECMQNFTSLSRLPYCAQSHAAGSIKLPCEYWDAQKLSQLTDQGLMIPTHISTFYQTDGCKPSAANNWTCVGYLYDYLDKKGNTQSNRGAATPIDDIFIADVERYTLLIDHSAHFSSGPQTYASRMQGYWLDCKHEGESDAGCSRVPIKCVHANCVKGSAEAQTTESRPTFRGDQRSLSLAGASNHEWHDEEEDGDAFAALQVQTGKELYTSRGSQSRTITTPISEVAIPAHETRISEPAISDPRPQGNLESVGVAAIAEGDVFSIGMLLRAANVSLDRRKHDVPSWVGGSYRSSGFVLLIRIHYTNIESWLGMKVLPWANTGPNMHYTYGISKHSSQDDFMLRQVHSRGPDDPKQARVVKEYHGIRVMIEQSGSVAVWDNIQLLLILTTTLALMAVANCITETVALHCMPESDKYWSIKFERPKATKEVEGSD